MVLEPNEHFDTILIGEAFQVFGLMLPHATDQIIRHARVKSSIPLRRENIDKVIMVHHLRTIQEQMGVVIPEFLRSGNIRDPEEVLS